MRMKLTDYCTDHGLLTQYDMYTAIMVQSIMTMRPVQYQIIDEGNLNIKTVAVGLIRISIAVYCKHIFD